MHDDKYCYPNSDVLINKLNITDPKALFETEKELTFLRLKELQSNPIKGNFDFEHLKKIHEFIFQDLYSWAGKERTVEISKGNSFCPTKFIRDYADSVFQKYYKQCYMSKDNKSDFIKALAENYGDLNALHPFREGNGRAQREFARNICLACGYEFSLKMTTHQEMLNASRLSFIKGDNSSLEGIFSKAVNSIDKTKVIDKNITSIDSLNILTIDDMTITEIDKCEYREKEESVEHAEKYAAKIQSMDEESEDLYHILDEAIQAAKDSIKKTTHKLQSKKTKDDVIH